MAFQDNQMLRKSCLLCPCKSCSLYFQIIYCADSSKAQVSLFSEDYYPMLQELNVFCILQCCALVMIIKQNTIKQHNFMEQHGSSHLRATDRK